MIDMKSIVFFGLFLVACSSETINFGDGMGDGGDAGGAGGQDADAGGDGDAVVSEAGQDGNCPTILVSETIYAKNCGTPVSLGSIAEQCDGKTTCAVKIDYDVDPGFDPSPGCPKDLRVYYSCGASHKTIYVQPEARDVVLDCCL